MKCRPSGYQHVRRVRLDLARLHCPTCGAYWTTANEDRAVAAALATMSAPPAPITGGVIAGQFLKGAALAVLILLGLAVIGNAL